jgi:hypothetical protein
MKGSINTATGDRACRLSVKVYQNADADRFIDS